VQNYGEIIIYQTEVGLIKVEVTFQGETVWLSLDTNGRPISAGHGLVPAYWNIFAEGELDRDSVVVKFTTTAADGKIYYGGSYNRDQFICKWRYMMQKTAQINVTLPNDMADMVKSKVQIGEYANESEVIRDSLRVMLEHDQIVENWLHSQVGSAYDALKADPSRAVTVEEVRSQLAAEHAKMQ
jgi:putative addiction module CopG family antidote